MHRVAVPSTVVAGIWLVARAPAGVDRLGAAIFACGALLMFVASSLVHLRRWSIPVFEALFRFDEVWHTFVTAAVAVHFVVVAIVVV